MSGEDSFNAHDLQTKVLKSENKRFYLDVKENNRGRFLKITEVNTQARTKNKITLALSSVEEFRDFLNMFAEFYNNLGPTPANTTRDGKLKSEFMKKDDKRYFLDLKENSRGRFLRVSQVVRYTRQHVAFPAILLIELRNAINEVLEEFGGDDGEGAQNTLPQSRECKVEQKKFYFDVGRNDRGVFLRLTEAKNNFRQNITIPRSGWKQVRDILDEFCSYEENGTGGYNSLPITETSPTTTCPVPSCNTSTGPPTFYKEPVEPGFQGESAGFQGESVGYQGESVGYQGGESVGYQGGESVGYQGESGYQGGDPGY